MKKYSSLRGGSGRPFFGGGVEQLSVISYQLSEDSGQGALFDEQLFWVICDDSANVKCVATG
jgi:hypothetical protein